MNNIEQVTEALDEIFRTHCAELQVIADTVDAELSAVLKANNIPWTTSMMHLSNEYLGSLLGQELRLNILFNLLMRDLDNTESEERNKTIKWLEQNDP